MRWLCHDDTATFFVCGCGKWFLCGEEGVVFGVVRANTTRFFCLQSFGGCNFTNAKVKAKLKANAEPNAKTKAMLKVTWNSINRKTY